MKKSLSLFLTLIMIFSSFAISLKAEETVENETVLTERTDFSFGINMFSYSSSYSSYSSYSAESLDEQIHLIARAGCKAVRIRAHFPDADFDYQDRVVGLCNRYGLKIIMVFSPDRGMGLDYIEMVCKSLAERYNGKSGRGFVDYIQVWNETDVNLLRAKYGGSGPSGKEIDHYYTTPVEGLVDLPEYTEYFKAAAKGIHEAESDTKFMLNFCFTHWGTVLWYLQHGVEIDTIGWDYYPTKTDSAQIKALCRSAFDEYQNQVYEQYPVPVMICETTSNLDIINEAYARDWIKGLVVYELLDEPNNPVESEKYYGLVNCERDGTIGDPKPIYYKLQRLWGGDNSLPRISKSEINLTPYDKFIVGTAQNTPIFCDNATLVFTVHDTFAEFRYNLSERVEIRYNKMIEFDIDLDDIPKSIVFTMTDQNGSRFEFDISGQITGPGWNHIQFNMEDGSLYSDFDYFVQSWGITTSSAFEGHLKNIDASDYVAGDATRDGRLNILDLIRTKKEALDLRNPATNLCAIDCDHNYAITAVDLADITTKLFAADQDGAPDTGIADPFSADLNGATVTIYQTQSVFTPEPTLSKSNNAWADMIEKLQTDLNCTFVVKNADENELRSLTTAYAASGKAFCDIMVVPLSSAGYYIASNLCADMSRISSMDCTKAYLNRYGVLNASRSYQGKFAIAANGFDSIQVVYFNKRILEEIGYDEIYLYYLVDRGKWTWEEFRNLAKKAVKVSDGEAGLPSEERYGFVSQDYSTGTTMDILCSMRSSMLKTGAEGELTYNMTDPKVLEALYLSKEILDDGTAYQKSGSTGVNFFCNGNALFLTADLSSAKQLAAAMQDEYGVLPVPQVSPGSQYSSAFKWYSAVLMIPAGLSVTRQYRAGAVVQAYMHQFDTVLKAAKKEYNNLYFCDEKSGEYWSLAQQSVTTTPEQLYARLNEALLSGTYRVFWDYSDGRINSAESAINAAKDPVINALTEMNVKMKKRK